MSGIITATIIISVAFTILAMFLRLRYVALIYVIGNIVFISSSGVLGGWYMILVLLPSFVPSLIGVFIGDSIRQWIGPVIGNKLSTIGHNTFWSLSKYVRKYENSALNLDGTPRVFEEENPVEKGSVTDKSPEK